MSGHVNESSVKESNGDGRNKTGLGTIQSAEAYRSRYRFDIIVMISISLSVIILGVLFDLYEYLLEDLFERYEYIELDEFVLGMATLGLLGFWFAARRWSDYQDQVRQMDELHESLVVTNAELTRVSNAKTLFLAKMSHELRTPLNAVIGFSDALDAGVYGPVSDRQTGPVRLINQSGAHLLNLVTDIVDVSRIEAGHLDLTLAAVDLDALVRHCVDTVRPEADQSATEIRYVAGDGPFVVAIDQVRTQQIVINLLTNAIRYGRSGDPIVVQVDKASTPAHAMVAVVDHGAGMSPDQVKQVTQPFIAFGAKGKREAGSVGLGLAIANGLAELQGGCLEISSRVGQGTTARLTLPLADPSMSVGASLGSGA